MAITITSLIWNYTKTSSDQLMKNNISISYVS